MRTAFINNRIIQTHNYRFEGKHYLNENSFLSLTLEKNEDRCCSLGNVAQVFNPPVFKRQFCTKSSKSIQYFQSSDVKNANENSNTFVFKEQADSLNLIVKRGDILVTGFGTIGNTRIVSKFQNNVCYANNVCRIRTDQDNKAGYIYAVLSSKYGIAQLNKNASGSVVRYIESPGIKKTLIPVFNESFQREIDDLINESLLLREEATNILNESDSFLKKCVNLQDLSTEYYDYYGTRSNKRSISCFTRNIKGITSISINAFNHSERITNTKKMILGKTVPLRSVLNGESLFSTGSFPRIEVKTGCGIKLINQSDIFDSIIKGKWISKRKVKTDSLVKYGEVLVAGVGTLGDNETFCHVIFANEDLDGELVSGEFIRMKTNEMVPSGYLFAWLNTDYGFRFIRNTQSGTKLCRPIPQLLLNIPVPIISKNEMIQIDSMIKTAHSKRHEANKKEIEAISMVEAEIEKWNKH